MGPIGPSGTALAPGPVPEQFAGGALVDSFIGTVADFDILHRSALRFAESFDGPLGVADLLIFDVQFDVSGAVWSVQPFQNSFPFQAPGGSGNLLVRASVPEPSTLALFAIGLVGLGYMTRRRRYRAYTN